jgi:hypothetical protein
MTPSFLYFIYPLMGKLKQCLKCRPFKTVQIVLIHIALLSSVMSHAQDIKVNQDGEKIVVFPDGSWRYYEAKDSLLDAKEAYSHDKTGDKIKSNATNRFYNFDTYQWFLSQCKKYEVGVLEQIRQEESKITDLNIALAKTREENDPEKINSIQLSLNQARADLQMTNRELQSIRQVVVKVEKVGVKGNYKKLRNIKFPFELPTDSIKHANTEQMVRIQPVSKEKGSKSKMRDNMVTADNQDLDKMHTDSTLLPGLDHKEKKNRQIKNKQEESWTKRIKFQWTKSTEDRTYLPDARQSPYTSSPVYNQYFHLATPGYTCDFTFDGKDNITSNNRRDLTPEIFFTYTDTRLKPYLKDREYITCYGHLSSFAGGFRYVTLQFRFASRNARKEYGYLRSGTLMNIKLINGKAVSLFSQNGDPGAIDPQTGDTVYQALFQIDAKKEKLLSHFEVDEIRIVWSSGYEDYEIYNVDFFINQLECLSN